MDLPANAFTSTRGFLGIRPKKGKESSAYERIGIAQQVPRAYARRIHTFDMHTGQALDGEKQVNER